MGVRMCGNRAREVTASGEARWPVGEVVKYYEALTFAGLSRDQVAACYDKACAQWSAVAGIAFERVADAASSNINAHDGVIDGPYGILAESELPYNADENSQMDQTYDPAEPWAQEGLDMLVACMCHEIGHAIGLEHLPGTGALMEPVIVPGRTTPQAADIEAVQDRYGLPSTGTDFRALGSQLVPFVIGPFCDGLVAAASDLDKGIAPDQAEKDRAEREAGLRAGGWDYLVSPRLAGLSAHDRAQAYRDLAAGLAIVLSR